ncbi:MAG: hypothetical protein H7256_05080 [Bdellovibrio sp.]|nr:hypothetical protein [Bdellovibrio sp.]
MGKETKKKNGRSWLRAVTPYLPKAIRFPLIRNTIRVNYDEPPQLEMRIARTQDELQQAYRILHDSYVDQGYMQPNETGMRLVKYFALPSTTNLIALWEGKVVATISVIRRTSFGLPLENIFDINNLCTNDEAVAEVSSLAIAKEFRLSRGALFFPFCKFFYQYSLNYLRLKTVVIAVNPTMADFYEGILGFNVIQNKVVSEYDFANGNPAVGLWADLKMLQVYFTKKYAHHKDKNRNMYHFFCNHDFRFIKYPDRSYVKAADPVLTSADLEFFFVKNSNILNELSPKELKALESMYPDYFDQKANVKHERNNRQRPRFLVEAESFTNDSDRNKVRIIDASETGVRMQVESLHFSQLKTRQDSIQLINLTVKVSESSYAKISGVVCWLDESKQLVGLTIKKSDQQWRLYINYLTADLNLKVS